MILQQVLIKEMNKEIENLKVELEMSQNEKKELYKIIENQKNSINLIKKINDEKK
jgi:hypothetical protein